MKKFILKKFFIFLSLVLANLLIFNVLKNFLKLKKETEENDFILKKYQNEPYNSVELIEHYSNKCYNKSTKSNNILSEDYKIHVLYAHFIDTNDEKTIENFKYFLNFAYKGCSPSIEFTFIFNIESNTETTIDDKLKKLVNSEIFYSLKNCKNTQIKTRENRGFDLCAYSEYLKSNDWQAKEKLFSFYFFINSSVRGPFLPAYWTKPW